MSRILLVGPAPKYITGQSEAFRYLCDDKNNWNASRVDVIFNNKGRGVAQYLFAVCFFLEIIYKVLFYRYNVIYLTVSRTKVGFFRDVPVFLLSMLFSIKLVVHLHGADFIIFRNRLSKSFRAIIDFFYTKISTAIVLSPTMKEQFAMYPDVNIKVINNCAPSTMLELDDPTYNGSLKVLYMSNLMATKGVLSLVMAVKELVDNGVNVELMLAGEFVSDDSMSDVELEKKIINEIRYSSGYISYEGVVSGDKKLCLFEWSNVVALPSKYITEAQPLVLIEGMMSGRYILSCDHNYISDIVKHNVNGYLIVDNAVADIKEALQYILKCPGIVSKVAEHNRCAAQLMYSKEKYLKAIVQELGLYYKCEIKK